MRPRIAVTTMIAAAIVGGCATGPSPTLRPDQIPAAFVALTQAADRTMHMEWSGTYQSGELDGRSVPFGGVLDFAGPDYAGTFDHPRGIDKEGLPFPTAHTEVAFVDGQVYQRSSYQGNWRRVKSLPRSFDPFRGLTADQISYVGREERDGAQVNHLRLNDASALAAMLFNDPTGGMPNLFRFAAATSKFDFYVDDDGRPVSAELVLASEQNPNDFAGPSASATYEFSRWDAEIDIIPPPSPR